MKVFRTSAGFEDVYVAATSRKAALEAWGTDKDLFARGAAEVVTDPTIVKQVLEKPGDVVRLSRATLAQHLSAAGSAARRSNRKKTEQAGPVSNKRAPKLEAIKPSSPKPSRAKLEAARSAIEKQENVQAQALRDIDRAIEQLRQKRAMMMRHGEAESTRLHEALAREEKNYRAALDRWAK